MPDSIVEERGRVLDVITDMHQYFHGKRVALFGDPDQLVAMTEFLIDLDMLPMLHHHRHAGQELRRADGRGAGRPGATRSSSSKASAADQFYLHQLIKNDRPDLLIGTTHGKYIARDEDLPFLRFGFPIIDRCGHTYFPTVGYRGAMRLLEKMLDLFLDRKDRDAPEEKFELRCDWPEGRGWPVKSWADRAGRTTSSRMSWSRWRDVASE